MRERVTLADIKEAVRRYYRLPRGYDVSQSRIRKLAHGRQVAMYLARQMTDLSYPDIGHHFGGRDHTTAIHGEKAVIDRMAKDIDYEREIRAIENILEATAEVSGVTVTRYASAVYEAQRKAAEAGAF